MRRPRFHRSNEIATTRFLIALLGFTLLTQAEAATVTALPSSPSNLVTSSFESPPIAANVVYAPSGTNWTFVGLSGIASNGSALMNGATAPAGLQVGVLRSSSPTTPTSSMTRSITVATAGRYRLHLKSAQRSKDAQTVEVKIDGNDIGRFKPAGNTFETVVFDGLKLTAGSHQITFTTLATTGDHTAFIDDVRVDDIAAGSRAWSSTSTWDTGTLPTDADTVVIPAGSSVVFDTTTKVKSLAVNGDLHCADDDISLSVEKVVLMGRMICGSPYTPYLDEFTLTLLVPSPGPNSSTPGNADYKALMVMAPGVLELHGKQRTSWTQLAQHATAGSSVLHLAEPADWNVGDWIVIAPTQYTSGIGASEPVPDMTDQSEVAQIEAIHPTGTILTLDRQLQFLHYGQQRTYSKTSPPTTWTLDERAEVGLLSRNIRIQGDAGSVTSEIGGHVMSMAGSQVHISGVELFRMGQKNIRGRYPFHWHLVGNAPGQYIRNSSIHASYNRCVTVHGTHDTLVADNVCHDFIGHGYFLEDGIETNNTFDHNLGVLARRPPALAQPHGAPYSACRTNPPSPDPNFSIPLPLDTDYREAAASNGPATFWISNPSNTYTNNVAAGSRGSGFWYHLETFPTGESSLAPGACDGNTNPSIAKFGRFENNRVRASRQGLTACTEGGGGAGMDSTGAVFEGMAAMNVGQGLWPCGNARAHFHNAVVANTENGMQAPFPFTFSDSLFVAYSDNAPARAAASAYVPWTGVVVYDQGFNFDNIHFVNYDRPAMSAFLSVGAAYKSPGNRSSNLSFDNSPNVFRDFNGAWQSEDAPNDQLHGNQPANWGDVINDLDGSLVGLGSGGAPRALTAAHPLMVDATCFRPPGRGIDGYACEHEYASLFIDTETPGVSGSGASPWITYQRSDGVHDTVQHGLITQRAMHNFISDGSYRHSYRFVDGFRHNRYAIHLYWARLGTSAVVELLDVPKNAFVHSSTASNWNAVTSLAALQSATANSHYYRTTTSSLFLKFFATGNEWEALQTIVLCMDASDPACTAEARTIDPPKVQITAPADEARVAANPSTNSAVITVTANLSDAQGLVSAQLYSGDILGDQQQWVTEPLAATPNLSIELPPGSHPLTLVARNSRGETFTAIQQIHVGDTAPRIAIDAGSPIDRGTYLATTVPNLQFTTYNWSAAGQHVHWFLDGVDQYDVPVGNSISLGALSPGYHDVEVALVDGSQNVYPMRDKRRIYIVGNGMLADYEYGTDPRGSLVLHSLSGNSPQSIAFAWTARRFGPLSATHDANWFDLPQNTTGNPTGTYTLALQPALSFSGYDTLRITYAGPGFDAWLIYANGAPAYPLGTTAHSFGATANLLLPNPLAGNIAGIELRHLPNPSPCTPTTCLERQHLHSIQLIDN